VFQKKVVPLRAFFTFPANLVKRNLWEQY